MGSTLRPLYILILFITCDIPLDKRYLSNHNFTWTILKRPLSATSNWLENRVTVHGKFNCGLDSRPLARLFRPDKKTGQDIYCLSKLCTKANTYTHRLSFAYYFLILICAHTFRDSCVILYLLDEATAIHQLD